MSSLTLPPPPPAVEVAAGAPVSRPRAVGVLGAGSLIGLVICSLAIVVIAAERPSFLAPATRPGFFPAWMARPLQGLWPVSPATVPSWSGS